VSGRCPELDVQLGERCDDLTAEGAQLYDVLVDRLMNADPRGGRPAGEHRRDQSDEVTAGADIWFLIDRSGSMSSLAEDVVSGFDRFIDEQRRLDGEATITVVQFDDEEPHDVLVDARPLDAVRSLRGCFEPRGMTPLYDAIAALLDRAEAHGGHVDDQLVVIFTDGMENASRRWSRSRLFSGIARLRDQGWTFVFLGSNQDSYQTGAGLAAAAGSVSNFIADPSGVEASYRGLSRTVGEWRGKEREARRRDIHRFWGDVKEAEQR
jgi:Mg-chelatase subunit ChlD